MLTKRDIKYFIVAKGVSQTSTFNRVKIGAVIVSKHQKEIVSVGVNTKKSHPLQKRLNTLRFDVTKIDMCHNYLHAEMRAILKANPHDLKDASLYIYRENCNHELANCRPCPACMAMIKKVKIKKIYYTTEDGYCEETLKEVI
jgi:deoxycytidylate deaminase